MTAFEPASLTGLIRLLPLGWLRERWLRPKLSVTCESKAPWFSQTKWNLQNHRLIEAVSRHVVHYYRVRVNNNGHTEGRDCHVKLQEIWFVSGGVWQRLEGWEPVDLIWSEKQGATRINISAKDDAFCDIGHVVSNYIHANVLRATEIRDLRTDEKTTGARLLLDLGTQYSAQPNALPQGRYCLKVTAFAANAVPTTVYLSLHFPGRFAEVTDAYSDEPFAGVQISIVRRPPAKNTVADEGAA